jgi:hypothetical protein
MMREKYIGSWSMMVCEDGLLDFMLQFYLATNASRIDSLYKSDLDAAST